jgi:hypothetical protein
VVAAKGGYRFLNNKKVTHAGITAVERQATQQRIAEVEEPMILAVQDTTEFNFAGRPALSGLGVLSDNRTPGFMAHTTLAVSVEGVPLGVLDQQVWSRSKAVEKAAVDHQTLPITEKESFKWLQGLNGALPAPKSVVTVCDREGDVYELFQYAHDVEEHFIVRATQDRNLKGASTLKKQLAQTPISQIYTLLVRRQENRPAREATVALRMMRVTLKSPKNRTKALQVIPLEPLTVQVVEVVEINPPADGTKPVHWVLLTTLAVDNLEDARRIVRFYSYRWLIERFHYVLKSGGCHFEDSQLRSVDALQRLLGICSRVAWRLLWLTYQARKTPDVVCTVALSTVEWQALLAFTTKSPTPPEQPPSLREAVRAIAKLGGFIGRKSDGEPGVKVLWRGWLRLQDIVETWTLTHQTQDVGNA